MSTVCEVCGVLGYEYLLLSCKICGGSIAHQYCLEEVIFDGSLIAWACYECQPRHEVTNKRSFEVSSERQSHHSELDQLPCGTENLKVKFVQDDETVVCTALKNNHDKPEKDTDSDDYVNDDLVLETNKPRLELHEKDDETVVCTALKNNHDKPEKGTYSDDYVNDDLALETNKHRFELHEKASIDLQQSISASVPQTSTQDEDSVDQAMPSSSSPDVLPKESNCPPSEHTEIGSPKSSSARSAIAGENQSEPSKLLHGAYSSSLSKDSLENMIVLEASATNRELSSSVENNFRDNLKKRRQLILPDDDDDVEVGLSHTVQTFAKDNRRNRGQHIVLDDDDDKQLQEEAGPVKKHEISTEYHVEETVQTRCLNGGSIENDRPVNKQRCVEHDERDVQKDILVPPFSENCCPIKKRRRYIEPRDEEDEVIVGSVSTECSISDVVNTASQTVDAKGHHPQSRTAHDSEFTNQERYIYSQPIDEPVWSGIFKIDNDVHVPLAAHISTKACQKVLELSRSLRPVVKVQKLPRLEAWPQSWKIAGPTDDSIGLYFFPNSAKSSEESDRLVKEIIDNDGALKIVVGTAELLMFPSILLPEQYHVFQGKHYLWGVFKRREDKPHVVVLDDEEGEVQERQFLDQQYKVHRKSSDEKIHETQNEPAKTGPASPGSSLSCDNPNSSGGKSNYLDQQEAEQAFTSSPGPNAQNVTKSPSDSLPPKTTVFGFVAARTARSQQLIQEMVSEGALLFSVPEEMAIDKSTGVGIKLTPDSGFAHTKERRQPIEFVPMDCDGPDIASEACLELFPVREQSGTGIDVSKGVDLGLSLGARPRKSLALS